MSQLIKQFRIFESVNGQEEVELTRRAKPVTRYTDNTRNFEDGTLWVFTRNGRPTSLMTCCANDSSTGRWWHTLVSLSSNPLRGEKNGRNIWSPQIPGIQFQPVPAAQPPADDSKRRLLQMRDITRRFTAHQFWKPGNQRFELRLAPRPVLVYADESAGVLEGGMFLFTYTVNPSLVLIVEAVAGEENNSWRYAIAKNGSAEFHAALDGKEVYHSPRAPQVVGRSVDPYFMNFSQVKE